MGTRGPRPTPTAVKKARGENRPSRVGKNEVAPKRPEHLNPPEDLSDDAKIIWQTTVAAIEHTGVISAVDVEALRAFCESAANYRKATALLAKSGPLIRGRNGEIVRSPAAIVAKQMGEQMRAWARELGLTPASRVGIEANISGGEHAGAAAKLDAILTASQIAGRAGGRNH